MNQPSTTRRLAATAAALASCAAGASVAGLASAGPAAATTTTTTVTTTPAGDAVDARRTSSARRAADPGLPGVAPTGAEVHLEALVGIPSRGYGMWCTTQADCHETGAVDLATAADVEVALDPATRTAHGTGVLDYTTTDGQVGMDWACEGEPGRFVSQLHPTGSTTSGELEVVDVTSDPRDNSLGVLLDPAGDTGTEFPYEDTTRTDGGCGGDVNETDQQQGLWYYHFRQAHRPDWRAGGDLAITGLTWHDGVYSRTFDRFVTVGFAPYTYPLFESTTIEVTPDYCAGDQNQVLSATRDGESLGLDGMRFFPGQTLSFPAGTEINLVDRSTMRLAQGGSFTVDDCEINSTTVRIRGTVKSLWMHFVHAVNSPKKKFEIQTDRAVAGVRGTRFTLSYDKAEKLTKVAVTESQVSLKRRGSRTGVMIKPGQVGTQKGDGEARIVRR